MRAGDTLALVSPTHTRPRVAVLFGGRSSEHEISCLTASGVLAAIDRDAYDVIAIGVTPSGRWLRVDSSPDPWQADGDRLPAVAEDAGPEVMLRAGVGASGLIEDTGDGTWAPAGGVDVVLPLLHGPYGEDGTLQGLLDLSDIRYVGAGVSASAICMDKHLTKSVLTTAGVPVGRYVVVLPHEWRRDQAACLDAIAALGLPVFVKPARAGSSVGITKVDRAEDLPAAVETAQQHDPKVVVEAGVEGREIECAVLGDLDGGLPLASLPAEIEVVGDSGWYDYQAKYLDAQSARLHCPADLPEDIIEKVRATAVEVFLAMGCEGLARIDVFVTRDGDVVVNEPNTMPGFTPISMYPRMWQASGLEYPELIDRLLRLALARPVGLR